MKTALIAGSTGLVGQSLLQTLLESKHYNKVITLVRRPLAINNPKLISHSINFDAIHELNIEEVDDVFCCLGTTIKTAGSQDAFTKVDYTYVVELARWAQKNKCRQFSVVSSVGASNKTSNFYLQTKGNMEVSIAQLSIPSIHIFRPSLLLGQRNEFRFGEKVSEKLMTVFNPLMKGRLRKYRAIKASDVAQAMFNQAQNDFKGVILFEGAEIK